MTEVVAALIEKEGKYLICKRAENKARGGLWEFVGGKIERGETPEQALARECMEELGIEVRVGTKFDETAYTYPDTRVKISLFFAEIAGGEIVLKEHGDAKFVTPEEMCGYEFCPADAPFLEKLKGLSGKTEGKQGK